MKKNELVHLHSLFHLLKRHFVESGAIDEEAFEEYEDLPVRPQHVYKAKGQHQEGVQVLADAIANELARGGKYSPPEEHSEAAPVES